MGISREELKSLPETLTVRLVRITEIPKGFRSRTIVVATTLLDPIETPADEIRALYRDRWRAELDLQSIKTHEHDRDPHRLSFTGTLHRLRDVFPFMLQAKTQREALRLLSRLLEWIAGDLVPDRPNRLEPRRKKRRPKAYGLLNKPRSWYHRNRSAKAH